jgi:cell division protein FtsI/penicillin-binding protein 2
MKPETSHKLQQAMLETVQRGTAVRAVPILAGSGWNMGGKTGTADVRRGHVPDGWFAGLMFPPDGHARYSIVVYLQNGGQGGRSAAPLAAQMTRWMAQNAATPADSARVDSAAARTPGRRASRDVADGGRG